MAQLKLPNLPDSEQALLYQKLNLYNRGRASYKEAGAYLVVLPREGKPKYTLWVYSPLPSRQSIFYLCDLSTDVHEALRMASTLCFYSTRSLYLTEYNAKRMQSRGDDLIPFGKYRGHFLHEILNIDPAYLGWIAYKFEPRIPKPHPQAGPLRAHRPHLPLRLPGHPAPQDAPKADRLFPGQGRRQAGKPDAEGHRRTRGRQSLQDTGAQRHDLLLRPPTAPAEGRVGQLRRADRQCSHGQPPLLYAARHRARLSGGRNHKNSLGTGGPHLYGGSYTLHEAALRQASMNDYFFTKLSG